MSQGAYQASLRTVLNDTAIYALGKALPGLLGMLTVIVFTRIYGAEGFGQYALLSSIVFACATLSGGWLKQAVLRFESIPPGQRQRAKLPLRASLLLTLLIAATAALAVFLFLALTGQEQGFSLAVIWLAMLAAATFTAYDIGKARMQARFLPGVVFTMDLLRSLGILALGSAGWAAWGLGYPGALLGIAVACLVAWLAGAGLARMRAGRIRTPDDAQGASLHPGAAQLAAGYFRFGWPLGLWAGVMLLMQVADRSIVGALLGPGALGTYGAIYELVIKGYAVMVFPVTLAMHPHIMAAANDRNTDHALSLVRRGMLLQLALLVPVLLVTMLVGEGIIRLLLGLEHDGLMELTLVLLLASGLWQLALLGHKPLELANRTMRMLVFITCALAVHVLASLLLVPRLGIVGAAWATLLSAATYLTLCIAGALGLQGILCRMRYMIGKATARG